jgi:hypothetical protein
LLIADYPSFRGFSYFLFQSEIRNQQSAIP